MPRKLTKPMIGAIPALRGCGERVKDQMTRQKAAADAAGIAASAFVL